MTVISTTAYLNESVRSKTTTGMTAVELPSRRITAQIHFLTGHLSPVIRFTIECTAKVRGSTWLVCAVVEMTDTQ